MFSPPASTPHSDHHHHPVRRTMRLGRADVRDRRSFGRHDVVGDGAPPAGGCRAANYSFDGRRYLPAAPEFCDIKCRFRATPFRELLLLDEHFTRSYCVKSALA